MLHGELNSGRCGIDQLLITVIMTIVIIAVENSGITGCCLLSVAGADAAERNWVIMHAVDHWLWRTNIPQQRIYRNQIQDTLTVCAD